MTDWQQEKNQLVSQHCIKQITIMARLQFVSVVIFVPGSDQLSFYPDLLAIST